MEVAEFCLAFAIVAAFVVGVWTGLITVLSLGLIVVIPFTPSECNNPRKPFWKDDDWWSCCWTLLLYGPIFGAAMAVCAWADTYAV
ncbi:MAG: hypothetical protein QGD90_01025 [Candidatus Hydrogenedentes bacterium]|nr:hypothetical protein [Candidatus Hydrogenedentota bacterium]